MISKGVLAVLLTALNLSLFEYWFYTKKVFLKCIH